MQNLMFSLLLVSTGVFASENSKPNNLKVQTEIMSVTKVEKLVIKQSQTLPAVAGLYKSKNARIIMALSFASKRRKPKWV